THERPFILIRNRRRSWSRVLQHSSGRIVGKRLHSLRSRRQHRPGVDQYCRAKPQEARSKIIKVRGAADSRIVTDDVFVIATSFARAAGSKSSYVDGPGVSLRYTPGFMLASAPRTFARAAGPVGLAHESEFLFSSGRHSRRRGISRLLTTASHLYSM